MKRLILIAICSLAMMNSAASQYRAYHKEDLKKYKKTSVKSFDYHVSTCSYGTNGRYRPQCFQGLQVISMNRPGGTFDDVYFIDKYGNTQYHTIRPTAPINTHQNRKGTYDSSNPSGQSYQSFGHAIVDGVATLLGGMLVD